MTKVFEIRPCERQEPVSLHNSYYATDGQDSWHWPRCQITFKPRHRKVQDVLFQEHQDDVINGNIYRVTGPLHGEFTGHRLIPLTKTSDMELWFFFICAWINGWVNNREAGDLRRHCAHYDVIVMACGLELFESLTEARYFYIRRCIISIRKHIGKPWKEYFCPICCDSIVRLQHCLLNVFIEPIESVSFAWHMQVVFKALILTR